jgi:hypothetical protein
MALRGITEADVEATLSDYHTHYTDPDGNPIYIAHPRGLRVRVVVRAGSQPPVIITVTR